MQNTFAFFWEKYIFHSLKHCSADPARNATVGRCAASSVLITARAIHRSVFIPAGAGSHITREEGGEDHEEDVSPYRCSGDRWSVPVRRVPEAGSPEAGSSGLGSDDHADDHCAGSGGKVSWFLQVAGEKPSAGFLRRAFFV